MNTVDSNMNELMTHQMLVNTAETVGLEGVDAVEMYVNNKRSSEGCMDPEADNKKIYFSKQIQRVINYCDGYSIDLPRELTPDFSLSPLRVKFTSSHMEVTITRETSPYQDFNEYAVKKYLDNYVNRYVKDENYRKSNRITWRGERIINACSPYQAEILSLTVEDLPADMKPYYSYAVIYREDHIVFYRLLIKSDCPVDIQPMAASFAKLDEWGKAVYDVAYQPVIPEEWTQETKEYYSYLKNSNRIDWGIFVSRPTTIGIEKTVPEMEEKIEYKFDILSQYLHFGFEFPIDFVHKCHEQGRIAQITYQFTTTNNTQLDGYTPCLDIYRGEKDEELRNFARQIKGFSHPFLFRLNNEMNTDWTSYSGAVNLYDPDIFIETWKRMYNIFKEEGVNNAIWIFNPFDGNYPPCKWNNFLAYMPPVEYVQLIGLTGYNAGTYNYPIETWREFKDIYDSIRRTYMPFFSEFPWVIPEFGSSSIGGDKAQWITDMFKALPDYPQIKAAVWFSCPDYAANGEVSRPFWLDETPETIEAFRKGVNQANNTAK